MSLKKAGYKALCHLLYYSGALSVIRELNKGKVRVLTYHRVDEPGKDFMSKNLSNICVPRPVFERQLAFLRRHYSVIPMGQFVGAFEGKALLPSRSLVITLDDGNKDNYVNAFPALQKAGVPATFFVVTDAARGILPDYYAYYFLLDKLGEERMLAGLNKALGRGYQELGDAKWAFRALPGAGRKAVLAALAREGKAPLPKDLGAAHFMDWREIRQLHEAGYDIQPHSASHAWLARMPAEELRSEIRESKAAIEKNLGKTCGWLAYPFGEENSFNLDVIEELESAGFKAAFLAVDGLNTLDSDRFTLRRCNAVPESMAEFACSVEGLRQPLGKALKAVFGVDRTLFGSFLMPQALRRARWLKDRLRGERGLFLDFGSGRVQAIAGHPKMRFAGFDSSWKGCGQARARNPLMVQARAERAPFKDQAFDGLVSSEVLEYVADDGKAVKEMNRVLKTGARLYITGPHADAIKGSLKPWVAEMNRIHADPRFGRALRPGYSRETLKKLFSERGFRLLSCEDDVKGVGRFLVLLFYHLKFLEEFGGKAPRWLVKPARILFVRALFFLGPLFAVPSFSDSRGLALRAEFIKERDAK